MTAVAFHFSDEFIDHVSLRIVNEVSGVCRVLYDSWYSSENVVIGTLI